MNKIIAVVTYEHPLFPAGGIAAVMGTLPSAVEQMGTIPVIVVTPCHRNATEINALQKESLSTIPVDYDGRTVSAQVQTYTTDCPWFLVTVADVAQPDPPFFDGIRHPYDVPKRTLLRDSLFFGAATIKSLPIIAKQLGFDPDQVEWSLFAQDWEAATTLLAFKSESGLHGRLYLTLHNSYDEFADTTDLSRVGIDSAQCPGDTILHRALSIIEQPAFTVSEQFALDLTQDLLQREIIAPQLQVLLNRHPVVGVDNGPFKPLALTYEQLHDAEIGEFTPVQKWKTENRGKALTALEAHVSTEVKPLWGDKNQFRRDGSPWLVMAGRDDPRQKGYDVAALAVREYLTLQRDESDRGQFLFFPIPGDEGLPGLNFLKSLAADFPEDVLVFPFIWKAGYLAALQGAAYGLMPSLYEPFGMANEFYLAGGCVGIARATGGNLQQVVPWRAAAACSRAVRTRADRYHALASRPTGILFREKDEIASASTDWKGINDAQYDKEGGSPSRVEQREQYSVFQEMARELRIAIEDGIRVHRDEPALYYRMLVDGIAHIRQTFSWERAAHEYIRKVR